MAIEELLARARGTLRRLDVFAAAEAVGRGAVLVDIRSELQRQSDGVVPDAVFIPATSSSGAATRARLGAMSESVTPTDS